MSSNNFGIGLLFESQKNNIKNDADILAILVHWILIKNNFRSVGVGDSVSSLKATSYLNIQLLNFTISCKETLQRRR